ncbi:hypothetical protein J6590_087464 [Homalodisca vitripennis]|nr:hypothetical protein J6590_087464 [Homalodisca vitripennis]
MLSGASLISRMDNIEVRGDSQTRRENVYSVLKPVARAIGVPYDKRDISTAHRFPVPRDQRFHPSIVVRFTLRSHNRALLQRGKAEVRAGTLTYAWCKDGKVFIRKTHTSRAIGILHSLRELDHLQDRQPQSRENTPPKQ